MPDSACKGVPRQLFTPAKLMGELLKWRKSGKMKGGKAGIKHFMKYLRDTDRTFRKFHSLVVDLGKPGKTRMPKEACALVGSGKKKSSPKRSPRRPSRR